jgi:hypothetical protein
MKHAAWFSIVLLLGCTGSTGDGPGGDDDIASADGGAGSGADADVPAANVIRLQIDRFTAPPGRERQVCKQYNLPVTEAVDVVSLRSSMSGLSHHFNVYKKLGSGASDPIAPSQGDVHDCAPASGQLEGSEAYLFGASSPTSSIDLPPGVAFHLEPGQVITLEHHVINAGEAEIDADAYIDLVVADPDDTIEHYADVMWMGNWAFYNPPGQESSATERCVIDYDIEVLRLSSHFHATGTHFSIEHWKPGGQTTHLYDSYDWAHPVAQWHDPPIHIAAGEGIEWTCTWFNSTSQAIIPGEESTDEMCIAFGLGYPKNSLSAEPINCNPPWF